MKLSIQSPKQALKPFLKQKPLRKDIDSFKTNLITLLDKIKVIEQLPNDESEEHLKNDIRDFLRDTYYKDTNAINTKDKKDLVIHLGKTTNTKVGVIIEAKRPSNKGEMITQENANKKALHELVLYYLNERIANENNELKQLVITNINEWYIIDANWFDKHIYRNTNIKKLYENKVAEKKDNPFFYEEVSRTIGKLDIEIPCVYFDITRYDTILRNNKKDDDRELIALFKILSPQHLLKIASPNDSNSLNEKFYKELLHIIGLEEVKEGGKNIIRRKKENRHPASLIETTIDAIATEDVLHRLPDASLYGTTHPERIFNVALELCITWMNRILFLKLLEGQLHTYHKGNKGYLFLNSDTINDFDELFKLFHKVLAVNVNDRTEALKSKYAKVPYLNSSLFEISELEDQIIKINSLDNSGELELFGTTVLKDLKKKDKKLPTLQYLFAFLDAYDFSSEGKEDIQEESKDLINASVLGKIFEKINGYKDGSIFTPGFITMYMCRQSIRQAVVQKFNETENNTFDSYEDVKSYCNRHFKSEDILRLNKNVNSLRICDPAVGSGHFLVSALNEIITVKSDLGILADDKGNAIGAYQIEIVNDELVITDKKYEQELNYEIINGLYPSSHQIQTLQKTLFHEKQQLIENCLFGVDINPNSVKICRLRLWIELLKNAYYKEETDYQQLETLPNIDINIKCGNSLLSRFAFDRSLEDVFKQTKYSVKAYKDTIHKYKNSLDKDEKRALLKFVTDIKEQFRQVVYRGDPIRKKIADLRGQLLLLENNIDLFGNKIKGDADLTLDKQRLQRSIEVKEAELEEKEINQSYKNSFEWRFEFPEVLDDEGKFLGFDVVIGNPPYGAEIPNRKILKELFPKTSNGQIDTYKYFIELCLRILKDKCEATFITSDSYLEKKYFEDVRVLMVESSSLIRNIKLGDDIFEGINLPTAIFKLKKKSSEEKSFEYLDISNIKGNQSKQEILNRTVLFDNRIPNYSNCFVTKASIIDSKDCKRLIDIYDQVMGVKVYQIGKGKPKQTSFEIENDLFVKSFKVDDNYYPYVSQGIGRYTYKTKNEWINYGEWLAEPRNLKYFTSPKVLIREIVNPRIFATYIEEDAVIKNLAAVIIERDKRFTLKYLLALLNSNLFTYYVLEQTPKSSNKSYPSINSELIKNIPIKDIGLEEQQPFIDLVDKILTAKEQNQDTSELEREIDVLVYRLYGLTEEEIKIVEGA